MANRQWEYTIVDTIISFWRDDTAQITGWLEDLNNLGAAGWEVIGPVDIQAKGTNQTHWPILLLKRELPSVEFEATAQCVQCGLDTVGYLVQRSAMESGEVLEVGRQGPACWNTDCVANALEV